MIRTDYMSLIKGYNKLSFYIGNFSKYAVPDRICKSVLLRELDRLSEEERRMQDDRVGYYIRLKEGARIDEGKAVAVGDFKYPFGEKHKFSAYFFDLYESVRCFAPEKRFHYLFGDVDFETDLPTFVKSRPIVPGETNSVVCKLNKVRHFRFVDDKRTFRAKKNMLVFRNEVRKQPQRTRLLEMYCGHPMCDVGQINRDGYEMRPEHVKPYMSIRNQLEYKFVACIEGHDVATNLKWVMSSNSLAVMPRPKIESWFMEGRLVGGYHYVEVEDDYSDLVEKMDYYISHPSEAEKILRHAHEYVDMFRNETLERCIQYKVVQRYFELTERPSFASGGVFV